MRNDFNIEKLVRENVKKLKPYSSARDEFKDFKKEMIFLDANENPFNNGVNRYPDPQQWELKTVLAQKKGVAKEHLLLGNGSDEVLDLLYRAFCEPGKDNVITLPPTYGMYKVLADINAIENKEVLLTADFQPDIDAVKSCIDQHTKLLFICSPNNPTGNSFDENLIEDILAFFKGLVIVDEAYIDFSPRESWLKRLQEFPNLIVTQTLSKAYGMAGIRLGICYASKEIVRILNKIKAPYNVNELTQKKAVERILNREIMKHEISSIIKERNKLLKVLLKINFILKVYSSDANFILVKVDDANRRYVELLDEGIVIRNRSTQPLCEETLRFTVGTPNENEKLIKVLQKIAS